MTKIVCGLLSNQQTFGSGQSNYNRIEMIEYVFDYLCDDIGLDEQSGLAGQETDPITILLIYGTTFIVLVNTAT